MQKRIRRRRHGFTLMEVLLVLVILVVLGSMVSFFFAGARVNAFKKAAKAQMGMFEEMLDAYQLDVGSYPSTQQGLAALRTKPSEVDPAKYSGPYSKKDIPADPWGNPYNYEQDGEHYRISCAGPDGQAGTEDDIVTET